MPRLSDFSSLFSARRVEPRAGRALSCTDVTSKDTNILLKYQKNASHGKNPNVTSGRSGQKSGLGIPELGGPPALINFHNRQIALKSLT